MIVEYIKGALMVVMITIMDMVNCILIVKRQYLTVQFKVDIIVIHLKKTQYVQKLIMMKTF